MFYEGDLQSGIAAAVQQSKCVVCFVRDDSDESKLWEHEWLAQDDRIQGYLQRVAVTLRLDAGSQEAGFLTSFSPVSSVPALVVIDQGKVEKQILSGVQQDAFAPALIDVLSRIEQRKKASPQPQHAATPPPPPSQPQQPDQQQQQQQPQPEMAAPETAESTAQASSQTERQARIQTMLEERRKRLEADKKAKDEKEKAEQRERTKAREARPTDPARTPSAQHTHAQQEKQRKLEAAKERERVLRLVEADKQERKEREERRRAIARAEREADQDDQDTSSQTESNKVDRRRAMVQVRLLDGSTMRASFFPEDRPRQAVRKWIDENRTDGDHPYTLKQVLTPAPSRSISEADEKKTLRELDMMPSASLVLVPIKGVVAAYQGGGARGLLYRFLDAIGLMFMAMFDALFRLMQNIMGVQRRGEPAQASDQTAAAQNTATSSNNESTEPRAGVNVRTLRDQRNRRDQLYNGNSLDFEPRKDDDKTDGGDQGAK